jgi:hypothetical protein
LGILASFKTEWSVTPAIIFVQVICSLSLLNWHVIAVMYLIHSSYGKKDIQ